MEIKGKFIIAFSKLNDSRILQNSTVVMSILELLSSKENKNEISKAKDNVL